MRYTIVSDLPPVGGLPGRLRLRSCTSMSESQAYGVEEALSCLSFVTTVTASHLTGSIVICYEAGYREVLLETADNLVPIDRARAREDDSGLTYRRQVYKSIVHHIAKGLLLPTWIHVPLDIVQSLQYLTKIRKEPIIANRNYSQL